MPEMELYILLPILVALCLITFFLGWYIQVKINKSKVDGAENVAKKILKDAETKSTELVSEAEKRAKSGTTRPKGATGKARNTKAKSK